jgi:hypothetical protein
MSDWSNYLITLQGVHDFEHSWFLKAPDLTCFYGSRFANFCQGLPPSAFAPVFSRAAGFDAASRYGATSNKNLKIHLLRVPSPTRASTGLPVAICYVVLSRDFKMPSVTKFTYHSA